MTVTASFGQKAREPARKSEASSKLCQSLVFAKFQLCFGSFLKLESLRLFLQGCLRGCFRGCLRGCLQERLRPFLRLPSPLCSIHSQALRPRFRPQCAPNSTRFATIRAPCAPVHQLAARNQTRSLRTVSGFGVFLAWLKNRCSQCHSWCRCRLK